MLTEGNEQLVRNLRDYLADKCVNLSSWVQAKRRLRIA